MTQSGLSRHATPRHTASPSRALRTSLSLGARFPPDALAPVPAFSLALAVARPGAPVSRSSSTGRSFFAVFRFRRASGLGCRGCQVLNASVCGSDSEAPRVPFCPMPTRGRVVAMAFRSVGRRMGGYRWLWLWLWLWLLALDA